MEKQTYDDQLIYKYLLGLLSEEEAERLDSFIFEDDEFAYRLQAVEDDLIDSYVKGELTGRQLENFKANYLVTPARRDKVIFAGALQSMMNRSADNRMRKARNPWRVLQPVFAGFATPVRWGLVAAAALLLLSGLWLVSENYRLRFRLQQVQAESAGLQSNERELLAQIGQQRAANSEIEKDRQNISEELKRLERERAQSQNPASLKELAIAGFTLSPQLRGINQTTTISIPPGTDYVLFQLELEPGEDYSYRARLKTQSGNQVLWSSGILKTTAKDNKGMVANVSIPASLLIPRLYILELSPTSGRAAALAEAGYSFRVKE